MKDQLKFFKKSLQILQKGHPELAHQLAMVDPSDLEFCWTQQEELNLKRVYEGQTYYYHSPISAREQARTWFQSLDLHLATTIFIYGIGLGYYYEAARAWLKQHPHHALIFLEEDLGVIFRLCETELGLQLLKDPQVQLVILRDYHTNTLIFNELSWTYFETPYIISSLHLYEEANPEGFSHIKHNISHQFELKNFFVHEYLQFGVVFYRNFYLNLLEFPTFYLGNGLFDCFPQVPAIICGAGPSLNKNIDLLPELKDRALIIAGGSALNALIPKGVLPHFGAAIDPNQTQYSRVAVAQPYHIPFFFRTRLFHEALKAITGPRLYLTGIGSYTTAEWFEKELNIEGTDIQEGHNVINLSIAIAQALGCNPIIIVGSDLAFTGQELYANGIANNLNLTEQDLKMGTTEAPLLLKKDIYGNPVSTLWKWISESEWISEYAQDHPELTFINATEGGLGFEGVPNLTLKEVAEKYLTTPREEIGKINEEIQKHSLSHITLEHILELIQKLKESLDHCVTLISKMIEEGDQLSEQIKQGEEFPPSLSTTSMSLIESDIESEIGYQHLLNIFSNLFLRINHRKIQDLQSSKSRLSKKKRALQKLELEKQRYVFLRDVARFNRELIHRLVSEKI